MTRSPNLSDVERWNPLIAKVKEAGDILREADVMLGMLIPGIDGDDEMSLALVRKLGELIERARMATGNVEHPVEQHWAGKMPNGEDAPNSLHWRYRGL